MQGKTLTCTISFFIFEKGASYYCFAEGPDYIFIWHREGYSGVHEIKVSKELAGKNFTIES